MIEFSYKTRAENISKLNNGKVKILVIGGGIAGAGVANILAQNGLNPVLIEANDFSSGTSSGSSKLIHGGLRYLAQGRIFLTRDLLKERNYLMKNTKIVSKLDFDIIIDDFSWSPLELRFGLFLYSILGGGFKIPRMVKNNGKYGNNVKGYFRYFDGLTDDSTLVIHNIISAHNNGAVCLNYAELKKLTDTVEGVRALVEDKTTGKEFAIDADLVINCAGPWVEKIMQLYGLERNPFFKLSKGIHIIVDKKTLPLESAIAFRSHLDKRQLFVIPKEKVVIIGTTDKFVLEPDDFSVPKEDVEYIIESVQRLFPNITRGDVITEYAGIRPLFGRGDDPGDVSRDFFIKEVRNMIIVFGGKITDYRSFSRRVAKVVAKRLGIKLTIKNMPRIDYERKLLENPYEYMIKYESAMNYKDLARRRDPVELYEPDLGKSKRKEIIDALKKAGLGDSYESENHS